MRTCIDCGHGMTLHAAPQLVLQRSPGTSRFEVERHGNLAREIAILIADELQSATPSVLEIGAGNWETSVQLSNMMPRAQITAIEPHPERPAEAVDAPNLRTFVSTLSEYAAHGKHDVCISVNVIEHMDDVDNFLESIRGLVAPSGVTLIVCPNGERPSSELLFGDHYQHFTRRSFDAVAARNGFRVVRAFSRASDPTSAVHILRAISGRVKGEGSLPDPNVITHVFRRRERYLRNWQRADRFLVRAIRGVAGADDKSPAVIFGCGEYTDLMRGYMPRTYALAMTRVADEIVGCRPSALPTVDIPQVPRSWYRQKPWIVGVHQSNRDAVRSRLAGLGVPANHMFEGPT